SCANKSAVISWTAVFGATAYRATAISQSGAILSCTSNSTKCQIRNLTCGENYTVYATALSNNCESTGNATTYLRTAPCPPGDVQALLDCQENQALVSWLGSRDMISFTATMEDQVGGLLSCSTTASSCRIPNLKCGQAYAVSVIHHDGICPSMPSQAIQMKSVPCIPTSVRASVECASNTVKASWGPAAGAVSYISVLTGPGYYRESCTTSDLSCSFRGLTCAQTYTLNVISQDTQCNSLVSPNVSVTTAPCAPQNVTVRLQCSNNTASVSWAGSPGAVAYNVTAVGRDGDVRHSLVTGTSCQLPNMHCSQTYDIVITPFSETCAGFPTTPYTFSAAPCVPQNVLTIIECPSTVLNITWQQTGQAHHYHTTVRSSDGQVLGCDSNATFCQVPHILCGLTYNVTVAAYSQTCNSSQSSVQHVTSAPCPPQNVVTSVGCDSGMVRVLWDESVGALSYTATLERADGNTTCCTANATSCEVTSLPCGQMYVLTVTAEGRICNSSQSIEVIVRSVPCVPDYVTANVICQGNGLSVSWKESAGAGSYTALIEDSYGHFTNCQSMNDTTCTVNRLACGQTYHISVTASDGYCDSSPSAVIDVDSVPCVPTGVSAVLDCATAEAHVSWNASTGALYYTAYAWSSTFNFVSCNSAGPVTHCSLSDLICGDDYTIQVIAVGDECSSLPSQTEQFHTVPCVPNQIQANLSCASGVVDVSWQPSRGAFSYTAVAQGSGGFASSCNSTNTTCEFTNLLCGLTYSISVTASDDRCTSTQSHSAGLDTVPCKPQGITTEIECGSHTGVVSWEQGEHVASYLVLASSPDGHQTHCSTPTSSCKLDNLHCGQAYNLTITAQDSHCDSKNALSTLQSG
ncbi:hypothetical protein PO909_013567, partial [Leuciscus waleckii]